MADTRFVFQERFAFGAAAVGFVGWVAWGVNAGISDLAEQIIAGAIVGLLIGTALLAPMAALFWLGGKVFDWRERNRA